MSPEYRAHALALLRNEPTRSLPLPELYRRLQRDAPVRFGPQSLARDLAKDARFRLLVPSPGVSELPAEYAAALGATGLAVEYRVLLVESWGEDSSPEPLAATRASLLGALARDAALDAQVSAAYGALEEIGGALPAELMGGAAALSTSPPPAPRAAPRTRCRRQQRA